MSENSASPEAPVMGRPKTDPAKHKKPRALSATDEEYGRLKENARAAGMGISEFFIDRCCFAADPAPDA